jgi:hypothetical protein
VGILIMSQPLKSFKEEASKDKVLITRRIAMVRANQWGDKVSSLLVRLEVLAIKCLLKTISTSMAINSKINQKKHLILMEVAEELH